MPSATPEINSEKITIEYDRIEDRLVLHCALADQTSASFSLTRRFVQILVNHLFTAAPNEGLFEIFQNNLNTSLPDEERVPPEPKTEPTAQDHQDSSNHEEAGVDRSTNRSVFPLLEKCDVSFPNDGGVILTFDLSRCMQPRVVKLSLSEGHLVQFLVALHGQTSSAGWMMNFWDSVPDSKHSVQSITVH